MRTFDPALFEHGLGSQFKRFHDLMPHRVHDVLLVSSIYDSFILEEDGRFEEGLIEQYLGMKLIQQPRMVRAASGAEALELAGAGRGFDLIITTMHLGDMQAPAFARKVREAGHDAPVVLLSYDAQELEGLRKLRGTEDFDKVLLWQGDFRILLAIVKYVEDRLNVAHDTELIGVQSILVIEDNVRYYSSFLPLIYTEVMRHSQKVLSDSLNQSHRVLRMRARTKILWCEDFDEAWAYFTAYHDNILGVISDVEYSRGGVSDRGAGVEFARAVRMAHPDVPVLLESSDPANRRFADDLGASFLEKGSPQLLKGLRQFLRNSLGFGSFVFRMPGGKEVARAEGLRDLERVLAQVPAESLRYHAMRNDFSRWLKARTEFWLAHRLRPLKVTDYDTTEEIRESLIRSLHEFRVAQRRGIVLDFDADTFDPEASFARLGTGSLGGKGRGLAFVSRLVDAYGVDESFPGVAISVPPAVVIATDVFDAFLSRGDLRDFAINSEDEEEIVRRFLLEPLPVEIVCALRSYLELANYPLAVRSSSLLEDSQHQPFAGIYDTFMLPNAGADAEARLEALMDAVKRVYASTFSRRARSYMGATAYRLEEEKMAVVIQRLVGVRHQDRFYPDFAGVARSHNFYPRHPMQSEDGIAVTALGLGATVVEGGSCFRFCPKYPRHVLQFATVEDTLSYSQREFFALRIPEDADGPVDGTSELELQRFALKVAEEDGTLAAVGSTYSAGNDAVYDGIGREGVRLVTFAPVLKFDLFPLPGILRAVLDLGRWAMSASVEIEFAVNLSVPAGQPKEFRLLQMRPMVLDQEIDVVSTGDVPRDRLLCESDQVLGNGTVADLSDIVFVDADCFERSHSRDVARDVGLFNYELGRLGIPYILIGVGRWGSADPWLGIPVTWDKISNAKVIVESSFRDLVVEPSEGSHFFQNLATMKIGYFTVGGTDRASFVDWDWLRGQPPERTRGLTRWVRLAKPLTVKMDGRRHHGVIEKPEAYSL